MVIAELKIIALTVGGSKWQNRAVEREKDKWIHFNSNRQNILINNLNLFYINIKFYL